MLSVRIVQNKVKILKFNDVIAHINHLWLSTLLFLARHKLMLVLQTDLFRICFMLFIGFRRVCCWTVWMCLDAMHVQNDTGCWLCADKFKCVFPIQLAEQQQKKKTTRTGRGRLFNLFAIFFCGCVLFFLLFHMSFDWSCDSYMMIEFCLGNFLRTHTFGLSYCQYFFLFFFMEFDVMNTHTHTQNTHVRLFSRKPNDQNVPRLTGAQLTIS